MTADQKKLAEVGPALFGERWQNRLADLLGWSSGRISEVLSDVRPMPADIDNMILAGLRKHAGVLRDKLATVERLIARFSNTKEI